MSSSCEEKYFDYIVLGLGGVGSAALYWLSKSTEKGVLGLEQFELGHNKGGSQDASRLIRLVYPNEAYTKLTQDSLKVWKAVEEESGLKLVHVTGGLILTRKGAIHEGAIEACVEASDNENIKYERISAAGIKEKYPQFHIDDDVYGLYDPSAGLVDAALANAVHIQLARAHGATVIDNCPVQRLVPTEDGGVKIFTKQGMFQCQSVVIAAGAWVNQVLGSVGLHIPVMVTQDQVTYYATPHINKFTKENFPVYTWHEDEQISGLPMHGNSGVKIGIDAQDPILTADTSDYQVDPVMEQACTQFLERYLPEAVGPVLFTKMGLRTLTKDGHFVIDTLKSHGLPQIAVCCGAGHVYKFASLVGKILSELTINKETQYDISAFGVDREAITNPNFKGNSLTTKWTLP